MSLAQVLDHVEHFLPGEDAFPLQQLHQRLGLPHGGEGQLVEGDEVVGVEGVSHDGEEDTGMGEQGKGEHQ